MTSPISWLSPAAIEALGWALIHFVWQGAAIAGLATAMMGSCRRASARYWVGVGALALMTAMPVITFLLFDDSVLRPPSSSVRAVLSALGSFPQALLPLLVQGWFAGVALLSLRFAGGFLLLEQKCRQQSTKPASDVLALCREVQRLLGIQRAIRYLECGWLKVPAAIGWLRPVILLPVAALAGLTETQLRAVIAHELAHVRRWDFLVNLFQILAETLLFYHPALWWLNRRIRAERELCCDEIAVSVTHDRMDYAQALVLMAKLGAAPRFAMAATHGILSKRIFHILGRTTPGLGAKLRIAGLAGSLSFFMAAMAAGHALFVLAAPPALHVRQNMQVIASGHIASQHIASMAEVPGRPQLESFAVQGAPPAATFRLNDKGYGIPRRNRLASIRTIAPSPASLPSMSLVIAPVDLANSPEEQPMVAVAQTDTPPHARSVVAQELDALALPNSQYPAPVLKLSASRSIEEWTRGEVINYCKNYAAQTVTQGANRPMLVDDGFKQRLLFFYWHCMLSNSNGTIRAYGEGFGPGPAYDAAGTAAADHPVNVAGNWAISFPSQPNLGAMIALQAGPRSCSFSQSGNIISGTCTGHDGSNTVTGIIDGRQVRWAWTPTHNDGRQERKFDFIGMTGPDGVLSGQSVMEDFDSYRVEIFTATPGGKQVAQK